MKKEKKKSTFFSDFKQFITRGNVVDMAVGVVIGGAFGKIITGLVNYIINPCVAMLTGSSELSDIKTPLFPAELNEAGEIVKPEIAILWGDWAQTIIDFLIVAFFIFLALRIVMKAKNLLEHKRIAEENAKAEAAAIAAEEAKKAAEEANAALAERQKLLETSVLNQEKLLSEICETLKNK